jgi:predicted nucleic acid-binding protein
MALEDLYQPLWSDKVHEEWITALLRNRPDLDRAKLLRTRALMEAHFEQAMVTGFESRIDELSLPDPDDRHVLAAAIHGEANIIITANLADFPPEALNPHGIRAMHPDSFIHFLIEFAPEAAFAAVRADRLSLKSPSKSITDYLADLKSFGLVQTAETLQRHPEWL